MLPSSTFIDPQARLMGDVTLGENVVVMFGAVIRGDEAPVRIGKNVVIQENTVIEAPAENPVEIGGETLISHGAIIHGAKIGRNTLIGIGAIILDGATVEDHAIIGAGTLIPPGKTVRKATLALGIPAKEIRKLSKEEIENVVKKIKKILKKITIYKQTLISTQST